jgi:hypothetical protein
MATKHDDRLDKLAAQIGRAMPGAKPQRDRGVPVNLRMPEDLRTKYVAEAGRRSIATGKSVTAQTVMLEVLDKAEFQSG